MIPDNTDLMVHDLIGRLFEEPEPLHRADLADGAIAQGMAVTRRRGFAVAGATLSVLAVVAGAVAVAGGGHGAGDDWSLNQDAAAHISPQAYENATPDYADRQREIVEQLPGVFGALLPAGVTAGPQIFPRAGGPVSTLTGDFSPEIMLHADGTAFYVQFAPVGDGDMDGYAGALTKASAKPTAVAGGSIRTAVIPLTAPGTGFEAYYEFTPDDTADPPIRFLIYGDTGTTPVDAAAFRKMVESPRFAGLRHLLDPAVPASASAVRERYAIEAKINAEAVKILPPGFRLKLNPAAPGGLELVGPGGVNTFQWYVLDLSPTLAGCQAGSLCFAPVGNHPLTKVGPDGEARLGRYAGWTGRPSDPAMMLQVLGTPRVGDEVADDFASLGKPGNETAPQGSGLTPQQVRAIFWAPGAAKVIADVTKLAAVD